jgi:predicted secreted protein
VRRPDDQTLWRLAIVLMLVLLTLQFCQAQSGLDWRDAF